MNYQATGLSAVNVQLNSATGAAAPGAFAAYSGTTITGTNPLVSLTGSQATFSGYVGWLQVAVTGTPTGATWRIQGTVYGSQTGVFDPTTLTTSLCTAANPCQENVKQVGGTAVDTNSGVKSAGTQRVVLATDQPNFTTPLNVQGQDAYGTTPPTGNPIGIAGVSSGTAGTGNVGRIGVCDSSIVLNAGAGATSVVIAGVAGKRTRICGIAWSNSSAAAASVQWKSGTGATCGTGTQNVTGVMVTTLQGVPFSIAPGLGFVMATVAAGDDLCVTTVASTYTGWLWFAQF